MANNTCACHRGLTPTSKKQILSLNTTNSALLRLSTAASPRVIVSIYMFWSLGRSEIFFKHQTAARAAPPHGGDDQNMSTDILYYLFPPPTQGCSLLNHSQREPSSAEPPTSLKACLHRDDDNPKSTNIRRSENAGNPRAPTSTG